jgi:murein DD-endopeptidase MepM/ murein hydrolase activator NlpD
MSTRIEGIFEPFADHVKDQLEHRRKVLQSRSDSPKSFFAYTTQKQCIIRMISGVNLAYSNKEEAAQFFDKAYERYLYDEKLAKQYILEGGTRFFNDKGEFDGLREGFTSGRGKESMALDPKDNKVKMRREDDFRGFTYGDRNIRADEGDGFGVVPMPGITDAEIRTRTPEGSLREARVRFRCHNRRQLEILEMLYMRPGYPILLEWGWNPYILSDDTVEDNNHTIASKFFKSDQNLDSLNDEIKSNKISSEGNYDGFIGYCKNFEFNAREDGGYDCTTEIIAHGEILESLKSKKIKVYTGQDNPDGSKKYEIKDAFLHYLTSIKHHTNKMGDLAYLQWMGTDRETTVKRGNESGRRKTRVYKLDPDDPEEEWLTETELNEITSIGAKDGWIDVKNAWKKVTKLDHSEYDRNFSKEEGIGLREILGGAIIKQVVKADVTENKTFGLFALDILARHQNTGYKKFVYVRWDMLCTILNQLCHEKYSEDKPLVELSYLGSMQKIHNIDSNNRASHTHVNKHTGTGKTFYMNYTAPMVDSKDPIWIKDHEVYADGKRYHPLLGMSYDPRVCLLPHQGLFDNYFEENKTYYDPQFKPTIKDQQNEANDYQTHKPIWPETQESLESQKKPETAKHVTITSWNDTIRERHSIGNVYFNLEYLIDSYEALRLEKITDTDFEGKEIETVRLKKDFYLVDFLKKIWEDVNEACAGFYKFQLMSEHERPNVVKVIDNTFDGNMDRDDLFEFIPQGINSISRNFNFSSKISNDIASVISIAAQAPNDVSSLEQLSFRAFHKHINNRFTDSDKNINQKSDPNDDELKIAKEQLEKDIKEYNLQLKNLKFFIEKLNRGNWQTRHVNHSDDQAAKKQKLVSYETAKRYATEIERLKYNIDLRYPLTTDGKKEHPKAGIYRTDTGLDRNAIIPLTFNIQLDGIAGLNPLNVFVVKEDRLPKGYQGDHICFIIKSESQKINANQDWTTEISGQLTLLNKTDKKYDVCLNEVPLTDDEEHVLNAEQNAFTDNTENNPGGGGSVGDCGDPKHGYSYVTAERVKSVKGNGLPISWGNPLTGEMIFTSPWARERPSDNPVKRHYGLDLKANKGDPILCPGHGVVKEVINNSECGYGVQIQHLEEDQGRSAGSDYFLFKTIPVVSGYCHMSKVDVKKNQHVFKGTKIGEVGGVPGEPGAGRSEGPHLHYTIRDDRYPTPSWYGTLSNCNEVTKGNDTDDPAHYIFHSDVWASSEGGAQATRQNGQRYEGGGFSQCDTLLGRTCGCYKDGEYQPPTNLPDANGAYCDNAGGGPTSQ